ncbi:uncharacterized protein LOC131940572 [Physella acuta]|uniref:uncharacterized protein LOC131940572 n=1 Tax=Physella acuta TaxID=109671 RepID=UPI0027DDC474|nr:uncharacterized protein LOC131940572 [Physella acuta]
MSDPHFITIEDASDEQPQITGENNGQEHAYLADSENIDGEQPYVKQICYDEYLKKTVGTYLSEILKDLIQVMPRDPIHYIAEHLYKCVDNDLYRSEKTKFLLDLEKAKRALDEENKARKLRLHALLENIRNTKRTSDQLFQQEFEEIMKLLLSGQPIDDETLRRLMALGAMFGVDSIDEIMELGKSKSKTERWAGQFFNKMLEAQKGKHFRLSDDTLSDAGYFASLMAPKIAELRDADGNVIDQSALAAMGVYKDENGVYRDKAGNILTSEDLQNAGLVVIEEPKSIFKGNFDRAYVGGAAVGGGKYHAERGAIADSIKEGTFGLTKHGLLTFTSDGLGLILPKFSNNMYDFLVDQLTKWKTEGFACESLYDHEIYTICEPDADTVDYGGRVRMSIEEFLEPTFYSNIIAKRRVTDKKGKKQADKSGTLGSSADASELELSSQKSSQKAPPPDIKEDPQEKPQDSDVDQPQDTDVDPPE